MNSFDLQVKKISFLNLIKKLFWTICRNLQRLSISASDSYTLNKTANHFSVSYSLSNSDCNSEFNNNRKIINKTKMLSKTKVILNLSEKQRKNWQKKKQTAIQRTNMYVNNHIKSFIIIWCCKQRLFFSFQRIIWDLILVCRNWFHFTINFLFLFFNPIFHFNKL